MKLYVCVDDTDDLTKSTSTGKVADMIANRIVEMGGTIDKGITRHQLFLHEDIDYTSRASRRRLGRRRKLRRSGRVCDGLLRFGRKRGNRVGR